MKEVPQQVSESVRRRNPHLYGGGKTPNITGVIVDGQTIPIAPPRRIRQDQKPLLNKLEQEWFAVLGVRFPSHAKDIYPQSMRIKLGNGIWYKPDFWCPTLGTWGECWEVKGPHSFRGGFENLKVAAHQYPQIKWTLVWKQDGQWEEQTVLP